MFRECYSPEDAIDILNLGFFSQFFIIGGAGAVESTVVGHLKTVLIVLLGSCKCPSCVPCKASSKCGDTPSVLV